MPLPPALEENLFRIAQEALHNVVKHAKASEAKVTLGCDEHEVFLRISDNGIGLRLDQQSPDLAPQVDGAMPGHGFGLANMRDRAAAEGGQLQFIDEPDKGTVIEVRIPLHRERV